MPALPSFSETSNEIIQARLRVILFSDHHVDNLYATDVELDFLFRRIKFVALLIEDFHIDVRLSLNDVTKVFAVISQDVISVAISLCLTQTIVEQKVFVVNAHDQLAQTLSGFVGHPAAHDPRAGLSYGIC